MVDRNVSKVAVRSHDESFAERVAREVPEIADDPDEPLRLVEPEILVDSDLLERVDEDGDLAEPD